MPGAAAADGGGEAATEAGAGRPTASERRRMYRDLALSLRCGLHDAAADFSFLRLRGLRALLRTLRFAAASDARARLFRQSQSLRDLQVIPVLFEHSLRKMDNDSIVTVGHVLGIEPVKLKSPATDSEFVLALRVLEGCCLLCKDCVGLAHRYNAVKVLLKLLSTRGMLEQRVCLDTLLALLLDSSVNLTDFKEWQGLKKVADLVKDIQRDDYIRLKCAEFLLLFSRCASEKGDAASISNVHADLKQLLGENCASFICSTSLFSSTLDPQERQAELSFQAERMLDFLEPY